MTSLWASLYTRLTHASDTRQSTSDGSLGVRGPEQNLEDPAFPNHAGAIAPDAIAPLRVQKLPRPVEYPQQV